MPLASWAVELQQAIRRRRTHKQYGSQPVDEAMVRELVDLARYAPNHHLTQPWRFRLLGPGAFVLYLRAGIPFIGAAILAVLCVRALRHVPCT